ncbi:unnamed protein product, partial [Brassica oleracea]
MKRKIDECFLERKKAKDDGSRVKTLEERVNNLEVVDSSFRMDSLTLKSKSGGVSLEKKKVDDADGSRVQQLEENLKNLEEIVSDLKVKLDQGKEKNSCDGFLLVDEDELKIFSLQTITSYKEGSYESISYSPKPRSLMVSSCVQPKGKLVDDHLSLFLDAVNPGSFLPGWRRRASYRFVLLNHSGKVRRRTTVVRCQVLDVKGPSWGFEKLCPLSKLQENGVLEKDRLIIEVYINMIEAVDGESGEVPEKHETVDMNGFKVLASQVTLVRKIFAEHPDIALGFKSKNQVLKTAYMNVLIGLINTLNKPSHNHSETELTKAESELSELEEVGFKLDWLKLKLEDVILERKKA